MCVNRQASGWRWLCVSIRFCVSYFVFCVSVCASMRACACSLLSEWSKQTHVHSYTHTLVYKAVTQSHTMLWQCIGCVDKAEVSMAFFSAHTTGSDAFDVCFFSSLQCIGFVSGAAVVEILQQTESDSLREWQIHLYWNGEAKKPLWAQHMWIERRFDCHRYIIFFLCYSFK